MELHPYDGVERRFRHTDADPTAGRVAAARVLRLPGLPAGEVCYDLSFYSGGDGVYDRLAVTLPADPALWSRVAGALDGRTPEDEATANADWPGALAWLVAGVDLGDGDAEVPIRPAAVEFINAERRDWQAACAASDRILFGHLSDVNSWTACGATTRG